MHCVSVVKDKGQFEVSYIGNLPYASHTGRRDPEMQNFFEDTLCFYCRMLERNKSNTLVVLGDFLRLHQ